MKILYYDCFAGISGDMNLGALIDLGVPFEYLKKELSKLGLDEEFNILIENEVKHGIFGTKIKVIDLNNMRMHNLEKVVHSKKRIGFHIEEKNGSNIVKKQQIIKKIGLEKGGVVKKQTHHHHHHNSRNFGQIKELINKSTLSEGIKKRALNMFYEVAKAEGKVHNNPIEEVHFHEVGAIDSIVDIVGAAILIEYLNVDKIVSSRIEVGYGTLKCAHGIMPVPAPATVEILKGIEIISENVPFEATTPTGAAIIKANADEITYKKEFTIEKIGYGIGEKENPNMANVLRVILGNAEEQGEKEYILECNIDDMMPEQQEILMERLFKENALDVFYNPIYMKKQRLGIKLSVISKERDKEKLKEIIFKNSSTIGVREILINRTKLERRFEEVDSMFGKIPVKISYYNGEILRIKPEYDNCKEIAYKENLPIDKIYNEVLFNYNMR